jgi:hypothetical protein
MSENEEASQDTLSSHVSTTPSEQQSCKTEQQHAIQATETEEGPGGAPTQADGAESAGEAQASSQEDKVHGDLPSVNDGVQKKPQAQAKSPPRDDWDPLRSRKDT